MQNKNLFNSIVYKNTGEEIIEISKGEGKTKKKAEQDASKNALIYYRVMSE